MNLRGPAGERRAARPRQRPRLARQGSPGRPHPRRRRLLPRTRSPVGKGLKVGAFHSDKIQIFRPPKLGRGPTSRMKSRRPFFKKLIGSPAALFRRTQAAFSIGFTHDIDGLAVHKAETGSGSGRAGRTRETTQKERETPARKRPEVYGHRDLLPILVRGVLKLLRNGQKQVLQLQEGIHSKT